MLKMPELKSIVINNGPLIAIVAATGSLDILKGLYASIVVPFEVSQEILVGGSSGEPQGDVVALLLYEKRAAMVSGMKDCKKQRC
jgi:predicted nucleic acid-binding protein